MRNVNYELIGSYPLVESLVDTLPVLIKKVKEQNGQLIFLDHMNFCLIAAHVYGFDPSSYESLLDLVDMIESADQELEFN